MKRAIYGVIALLVVITMTAGCTKQQPVVQTVSENDKSTTVTTTVPTLSVTGLGEKDVTPDMATVNLGINISKPTADEAMTAASNTIDQMKAKMLELGIKAEDMQTINFNIYPDYNYNDKGEISEVKTYHASNMLEVKIHDLTKVGTIIDGAVKAGANSSYGISFGLADPLTFESDTLKLAVENAKKKAAVLAESVGKKLGDILVMTDGTTSIPETYVQESAREDSMKAGAVSISPGTLKVTSSVTVRFALQ